MDGRIVWFGLGLVTAYAFHKFVKPVAGKGQ
jgi:hypothetical protein